MISYFKELLKALKSIDENLKSIAKDTKELGSCVKYSSRSYGDKKSISITHWND